MHGPPSRPFAAPTFRLPQPLSIAVVQHAVLEMVMGWLRCTYRTRWPKAPCLACHIGSSTPCRRPAPPGRPSSTSPTRWCVRQAVPELQVEGLVHEAGSLASVHGGCHGVVQLGPPQHGTGYRRLVGYSRLP